MLKKAIRLALALAALLLVSAPIVAEAATVTGTATIAQANVPKGQAALARINGQTCVSLGLPKTCTDAQAKAVNPQAAIYADANAYASAQLQKIVDSLLSTADEYDRQDFIERYRISTQAQRDAAQALLAPLQ